MSATSDIHSDRQELRKRRSNAVPGQFYREIGAGGFSRKDGTVQFYFRVNALLRGDMIVADLGAGRGAISDHDVDPVRRLATLKGKVAKVIGIDVDDSVMKNPLINEAITYDGTTVPLPDASVDLIVSDHTFEHVLDPAAFAAEAYRILKPGGWLCARTPYFLSLTVLVNRFLSNPDRIRLLRSAQPNRESFDVFPAFYKLNSGLALRRHFPPRLWTSASYTWTPEPAYYFGNKLVFGLLVAYYALKRPLFGEVLLVFLQKRDAASQ